MLRDRTTVKIRLRVVIYLVKISTSNKP